MGKKKVAAGVGAALIAVGSIVTLGLLKKKKKGKEKEKESEE